MFSPERKCCVSWTRAFKTLKTWSCEKSRRERNDSWFYLLWSPLAHLVCWSLQTLEATRSHTESVFRLVFFLLLLLLSFPVLFRICFCCFSFFCVFFLGERDGAVQSITVAQQRRFVCYIWMGFVFFSFFYFWSIFFEPFIIDVGNLQKKKNYQFCLSALTSPGSVLGS